MSDLALQVERQRVVIDDLFDCINACLAFIEEVDPLSDASMALLADVATKITHAAMVMAAPAQQARA